MTTKKLPDLTEAEVAMGTEEYLEHLMGGPLTLGDVIKDIREDQFGMTQAAFSRFLGIPRQHLYGIEHGTRLMSAQTVKGLAKKMKHPPELLVYLLVRDQTRASLRKAGLRGNFQFNVAA